MEKNKRKSNAALFAVLAICAAPMIVSYFVYYVVKPTSRNNYGTLIDPRERPIPALGTTTLDGKPVSLKDYKGKWLMVQVDGGDCAKSCQDNLFKMRQLRLMQGKERDRIERVWLITDDKPLETVLMRTYDGTRMLRADPKAVSAWLPAEPGTTPADHIYLVDPLGNLMMRFPKDGDPYKMKKDISKLLMASGIG